MLRSLLVLFICCVAYCVADGDDDYFNPFEVKQDCGPNEVPKGCIDPCPTENTCQHREDYLCLDVVRPCSYQCHCKEGYIRKTEGGECIPIEECGVYCGRNSEYTDCKPSCVQYEPCFATKKPSNSSCVNEEPCKPGCVCKEGYVELEEDSTWCYPRCLCPEYGDTEECLAWNKG